MELDCRPRHNTTLEALAALWMCFTAYSFAATIQVPGDQPTIQFGINAAQDGDTVIVAPGTYLGTIDFIGRDIIVQSSGGPEVTTIDAQGLGTAVRFTNDEPSTAVLEGFTIANGQGSAGCCISGGVFILEASPQILNNIFTGNQAHNGAAITVQTEPGGVMASPLIRGNHFENNQAIMGGGGIYIWRSSGIIEDNTFVNNRAEGGQCTGPGGGAITLVQAEAVEIRDNHIENNLAECSGGGVFMIESSAELEGNDVLGNRCGRYGGGIYTETSIASDGIIVLRDNLIQNNVAEHLDPSDTTNPKGGGIAIFLSTVTIENCDILSNESSGPDCLSGIPCGFGGGIGIFNSTVTILDSRIESNETDRGGGLWLDNSNATDSELNIDNCQFLSNTAYSRPAIGSNWAPGSMTHSTVSGNTLLANAPPGGAGYSTGSTDFQKAVFSITGCTFSGNEGQFGGGLSVGGSQADVIVANNVISGNTGRKVGGGVVVRDSASATISENEIRSNAVVGDDVDFTACGGLQIMEGSVTVENNLICDNLGERAGGVSLRGNLPCVMVNNTIVSNHANELASTHAGGLFVDSTTLNATLHNNIIAFNNSFQAREIAQTAEWRSNFIDASGLGMYFNPSSGAVHTPIDLDASPDVDAADTLSGDPWFVSAMDCDYRLWATSPCVGEANPTLAPGIDIDGTPRPQGEEIDIGAFEVCPHQLDGTIGGQLWIDLNENGSFDPGEEATDLPVDLFADTDCDGVPEDPALDSTISGLDGQYLFTNVFVGQPQIPTCYVVDVDATSLGGCVTPATSSTPVNLSCDLFEATEIDFRFVVQDYHPYLTQWPMPANILVLIDMICAE